MTSFHALFISTLREMPQVFRRAWPWLLAMVIVNVGINALTDQLTHQIMQRGSEDIAQMFSIASLKIGFEVIWSGYWLTLVSLALQHQSPTAPALLLRVNQLMIEIVRTYASILRWTLLLLIPGFIRFIQLALVPFVVLQDRDYQKGDVDALERSQGLMKNHFHIIVLAWVILMIVDGLGTSLASDLGLLKYPWQVLIDLVTQLFFAIFGFRVFAAAEKLSRPTLEPQKV